MGGPWTPLGLPRYAPPPLCTCAPLLELSSVCSIFKTRMYQCLVGQLFPLILNDLIHRDPPISQLATRIAELWQMLLSVRSRNFNQRAKPSRITSNMYNCTSKRMRSQKVTHSEWAAPIVTVPKPDGRIRVCGDYKFTVNQALAVDQYPLPKPEDLFTALTVGKKFSKLDLSQAYLQLALTEESTKYCTGNTHQGLYRFERLRFGVTSAPAMFLKIMDTILQGMPNDICYIDDILITREDDAMHLDNLAEVLARLEEQGIWIKWEKCDFLQDSVEYLGHVISSVGIRTIPAEVKANIEAPYPQNVNELCSLLGLINYWEIHPKPGFHLTPTE